MKEGRASLGLTSPIKVPEGLGVLYFLSLTSRYKHGRM